MKFEGSVVVRKRQWVGRWKDPNTMTAVLLVVGLDGYDHSHYSRNAKWESQNTTGLNVHMSMNGPMQMTFEQMAEFTEALNDAVATAKFELGEHHFTNGI